MCPHLLRHIRCVRLEAVMRRMISVWHHSTARGIREQTDHFESLSLYFDVTHLSFCAALLQVEHTYGENTASYVCSTSCSAMKTDRRLTWSSVCRLEYLSDLNRRRGRRHATVTRGIKVPREHFESSRLSQPVQFLSCFFYLFFIMPRTTHTEQYNRQYKAREINKTNKKFYII